MRKEIKSIFLMGVLVIALSGCVNQHPQEKASSQKGAYLVPGSKAKKQAPENPRIVATSAATCDICERLNLDLVGRPKELTTPLPERYMKDKSIREVGSPMAPDMEVLKALNADYVIGPATLRPAFEEKYQNADIPYLFINLKSVQGLYKSMEQMGQLFGREKEAEKEIQKYEETLKKYKAEHKTEEGPKVLILMGVPGAYIVATPNSYVGNLVAIAGGKNVYADEKAEFLEANTEDMKKREPDVILRCAHALPDVVKEMFAEEFETNDIWKHFEAVKNGKTYDLKYETFGMSAKFNWPEALEELEPYLYEEKGGAS